MDTLKFCDYQRIKKRSNENRQPKYTLADFARISGESYYAMRRKLNNSENKPEVRLTISGRNYYLLADLKDWHEQYTNK